LEYFSIVKCECRDWWFQTIDPTSKGYGRSVKEVFITISKTTAKISDEIEIEATTPVKLIIKERKTAATIEVNDKCVIKALKNVVCLRFAPYGYTMQCCKKLYPHQ